MVNGFRAKYQPRNQSQSIKMLSKYINYLHWWWPENVEISSFLFLWSTHGLDTHGCTQALGLTLWPLTGEVNNTACPFIWQIGKKPNKLVLETEKMSKSKYFKCVEASWLTGSEDFQNCSSVREPVCRLGQTVPIDREPTSQLTGLKGSFRVQRRPHLHGLRCFGSKRAKIGRVS